MVTGRRHELRGGRSRPGRRRRRARRAAAPLAQRQKVGRAIQRRRDADHAEGHGVATRRGRASSTASVPGLRPELRTEAPINRREGGVQVGPQRGASVTSMRARRRQASSPPFPATKSAALPRAKMGWRGSAATAASPDPACPASRARDPQAPARSWSPDATPPRARRSPCADASWAAPRAPAPRSPAIRSSDPPPRRGRARATSARRPWRSPVRRRGRGGSAAGRAPVVGGSGNRPGQVRQVEAREPLADARRRIVNRALGEDGGGTADPRQPGRR